MRPLRTSAVPSGLRSSRPAIPTLKCWAIVARPSGTIGGSCNHPAVRGRWSAPLPGHGGSGGLLRRKGLQVEFGPGTIDQRLGLAEQIGAKQTQDNRRKFTRLWLQELQLVHSGVKVLLLVCADF